MRRALLPTLTLPARVRPAGGACATEADRRARRARHRGRRSSSRPTTSTRRSTSRSRPTPASTATRRPPATRWWRRRSSTSKRSGRAPTRTSTATPYEPISGGFWAYGPGLRAAAVRRARRPTYDEIAENAFYCPGDDLIAWDNVNLDPRPVRGVRRLHPRHRVRPRVRPRHPDARRHRRAHGACWSCRPTASPARGPATSRRATPSSSSSRSTTSTRPWPASSSCATASAPRPRIPAAHGTGFDRIGSFVDGYEQGVEHCAGYPDALATGELVIVEVPFTEPGGLRPRRQPPARRARARRCSEDLENFWTVALRGAGPGVDPGHRRGPDRPRRRRGAVRRRDLLGRRARERVLLLRRRRHDLHRRRQPRPGAQRDRRLRRRHRDRPPVRLRRPGAPRDRGEHARDQPPRRLPHRRLRVERLPRRPRGPGPGALPLPRRPRRGRDRVPPQQRRQRGRSRTATCRSAPPSSASTPTATASWPAPAACDALLDEG